MIATRRTLSTTAIGAAIGAMLLASPVGAAAAGTAEPAIIVNRETVQVALHSSGSLDTARLFSQLVVTGDGKYQIADPTSGKNIRDLDGFSTPSVKNGSAQYSIDVHGKTTRRTVSDFTRALPLTIKAEYTLDGKRKAAKDIVGKTGILDVRYTVENVSATPTQLTYTVAGRTYTKTVDLVTPYVGQLTVTLPSSFTDVDSPRADVAGDGRGGQLMNWTMVLFEPIGQVKQTFGYTAHVKDATIPAASVQALPVSPNRHPELAYGENGFSDGLASAGNVAFAGTTIDTNMVKLRDGAGDLLAGLTKLAAGAAALKDGLAGSAAPGAHKLADGLGAAKDGSSKLAAGATQLSDGLALISAGLDQLAGTSGLPAAKAGAVALRAGVDKLLAGLGSASTPGTILNGVAQISGGLTTLGTGITAAKGGVDKVQAGLAAAAATGGGVDTIKKYITLAGGGIAGCTVTGAPKATPATACDFLNLSLFAMSHPVGALGATDAGGLKEQTKAAADGLALVSGGLGTQALPGIAALSAGVSKVNGGLLQVVAGLKSGDPKNPGLAEGLDSLVAGLTAAVSGVTKLAAGATTASSGSAALADGTKQVAAGTAQLSAGSTTLADGLDAAASGSGQLADGLQAAKAGNGQVRDGVEALRTQAAVPLAAAGQTTAVDYAQRYATMQALDQKGADGALPYGAPAGATGSAAYMFTLAGATSASKDNTTRGIAAIVVLALASLSGYVIRRRVAG